MFPYSSMFSGFVFISLIQLCFLDSLWTLQSYVVFCAFRESHLFRTLWTDFGKESLSPVGRGVLDCGTLDAVVHGAKCGGMHCTGLSVISVQLRPLESTVSTTMWSLENSVEVCSDYKGC